jgi:hypothetical protein
MKLTRRYIISWNFWLRNSFHNFCVLFRGKSTFNLINFERDLDVFWFDVGERKPNLLEHFFKELSERFFTRIFLAVSFEKLILEAIFFSLNIQDDSGHQDDSVHQDDSGHSW